MSSPTSIRRKHDKLADHEQLAAGNLTANFYSDERSNDTHQSGLQRGVVAHRGGRSRDLATARERRWVGWDSSE